jgi:hypothetical protein
MWFEIGYGKKKKKKKKNLFWGADELKQSKIDVKTSTFL